MGKDQDTIKISEVAYSNLLTINALLELLDERGVLPAKDVRARALKLKAEARIKLETP